LAQLGLLFSFPLKTPESRAKHAMQISPLAAGPLSSSAFCFWRIGTICRLTRQKLPPPGRNCPAKMLEDGFRAAELSGPLRS
jgi:hypothetical protein